MHQPQIQLHSYFAVPCNVTQTWVPCFLQMLETAVASDSDALADALDLATALQQLLGPDHWAVVQLQSLEAGEWS